MTDLSNVDAYNLSIGVLGHHPDEFYGAIGRVVCVCSLLEDQVTTLRHTLAGASQGQFTQQPVKAQINAARALASALPAAAADIIAVFLDQAADAFSRRNDLAHSSFPAQPDGRLWGHRPARDRTAVDGRADMVETSIQEIREFIGELSVLVRRFNQVHALAVPLPTAAQGHVSRNG